MQNFLLKLIFKHKVDCTYMQLARLLKKQINVLIKEKESYQISILLRMYKININCCIQLMDCKLIVYLTLNQVVATLLFVRISFNQSKFKVVK